MDKKEAPGRALDCIVVGGGAAGLAAALILGRARRRVTVFDSRNQSNLPSRASHGAFTRDGAAPEEIYQIAREQALAYQGIEIVGETIVEVRREGELFAAKSASGKEYAARTVLLSQGMRYELPEVEGLRDIWGTHAWHCPYCDGFESAGKALIAIGTLSWIGKMSVLLPQWSRDISWSPTDSPIDEKVSDRIRNAGGSIIGKAIAARRADDGVEVELEGGTAISAHAIVVETAMKKRDDIAVSFGCSFDEESRVKTDEFGATSAAGVFAAGDQACATAQVNIAAASGNYAGIGMNLYLAQIDRESESR